MEASIDTASMNQHIGYNYQFAEPDSILGSLKPRTPKLSVARYVCDKINSKSPRAVTDVTKDVSRTCPWYRHPRIGTDLGYSGYLYIEDCIISVNIYRYLSRFPFLFLYINHWVSL